ncbi:Zn-dependent exopeptidase [Fomes fomentarius]|nr:Zn-dependent exopeptidase [Fomes fomentarius]
MMLVNAVAPLGLLLVTPYSSSFSDTCLSRYYHGTHGQQNVFITSDETCISEAASHLTEGAVVPLKENVGQLVWLQKQAVDDAIDPPTFVDDFNMFFSRLSSPAAAPSDGDQVVFAGKRDAKLLHRTMTSAVVSVDSETALTLDQHLPRFWKASPLPSEPVPFIPVPPKAIDRVKTILDSIKFDPVVASVVNNISVAQLRADVRYLTGESPTSEIVSRHSFSKGVLVAADWLKANFESHGASCTLKPFLSGFAPNVVCTYKGTENTTDTVLISAHYDSRGSFGSVRAPGGDDDGSGTVALLGIARVIARKGVKFRKNIQLVAFAGEEQGLYGSRYYAKELHEKGANLTLMIQADMLAYHAAGEPAQLGLPDIIGTTEVTQLVANLSAIYSPELKVGFTPACCSDHQSFHQYGFPATQVFERAGPIADPMYHNSGDLSDRDGYDFEQIKSIAKIQFATLLHSAGFELPSQE